MNKTHYFVWYKCKNCGYEASRELPYATEAPTHLECTNCGNLRFEPSCAKKPPYR